MTRDRGGAGGSGVGDAPGLLNRGAGLDREALTIAMTVVPGVISRNKCFALYEGEAEVRRARARAAVLRGVVRQLAGAHGQVSEVRVHRDGNAAELAYRVASVRLERRVQLSEVEVACVAYLAARAGGSALPVTDHARSLLDAALRRLAMPDLFDYPRSP